MRVRISISTLSHTTAMLPGAVVVIPATLLALLAVVVAAEDDDEEEDEEEGRDRCSSTSSDREDTYMYTLLVSIVELADRIIDCLLSDIPAPKGILLLLVVVVADAVACCLM